MRRVARTTLVKQTLDWGNLVVHVLFFVHMHSKYTCSRSKWMLVEFHTTFCLKFWMMSVLWFPTKGQSAHMIFWTVVTGLVSERLAGIFHHPCKVLDL